MNDDFHYLQFYFYDDLFLDDYPLIHVTIAFCPDVLFYSGSVYVGSSRMQYHPTRFLSIRTIVTRRVKINE
jgi:hypothetical protein